VADQVEGMDLQPGDWVVTTDGHRGQIIHCHRMTVFVTFHREGKADIVSAFLESDITKVDPPESISPSAP